MKHSHPHHDTMKAVQFEGKILSVSVNTLPIPKIINSHDAIIRVTSAAICGSDLHLFKERIASNPPFTIGHEVVGIVHAIGADVDNLKVGHRVIITGALDNDVLNGVEITVGALGIGTVGRLAQFDGGQAGYVRVPSAMTNCLLLPPGREYELDYLALSDIFPTANWALDAARFVFGDVVVVFGAGPVGLMCAYSALLRGASKVYSVDRVSQRLAKAKSIGAIPIDFSKGDPVAQITKLEPGGVDRCCDCVGAEAVNAAGVNVGNLTYIQAIELTKFGGGIGLVGGFVTNDKGAPTAKTRKGIYEMPIGLSWEKSLTVGGGIVPLRQYQEPLKKLIESGRAKPSFVFDHEIRIEEAEDAYQGFFNRDFIKCVIRFDDLEDILIADGEEEKESSHKKLKRNVT